MLPDVLDRAERERTAAFAFPHLRLRYETAHKFLRIVLSRYMGIEPAVLAFATSSNGKPYLAGPFEPHFNLTHAEGVAYVAISANMEIGIDVEVHHGVPDATKLAETVFSGAEQAELGMFTGAERDNAFLTCWTRKEAYLKALGLGIGAVDLQSITVGTGQHPMRIAPIAGVSSSEIHVRTLLVQHPECVAIASGEPPAAVEIQEFHGMGETD